MNNEIILYVIAMELSIATTILGFEILGIVMAHQPLNWKHRMAAGVLIFSGGIGAYAALSLIKSVVMFP